jgi:hypothetical protein
MKTLKLTLAIVAFGLVSFTSATVVKEQVKKIANASTVVWKSETVEVGEIPQGTPKTIEFSFKNTGNKSVLITNVKPACGCTAADYTKEAVAPGKMGYVKATYNAAAAGAFTKTITVTTNAEETPKVLTFKGTVIAKS